jgi:hypothetical protein
MTAACGAVARDEDDPSMLGTLIPRDVTCPGCRGQLPELVVAADRPYRSAADSW